MNGTSSQLPITMKCVLPPKVKRNSPESWRPCQSIVIFEVTVTDSKGDTGKDLAGFIADPQCSSRARKQVARRTIERAAEEIWGEIPRHIADEIGVKGIEHALEAGDSDRPWRCWESQTLASTSCPTSATPTTPGPISPNRTADPQISSSTARDWPTATSTPRRAAARWPVWRCGSPGDRQPTKLVQLPAGSHGRR